MKNIICLYKKKGETPLACVERFKDLNKEYLDVPLTYAGRLDPMAEGLLLVLAGDERYKKEKYLNLNKVYEVEILLGIETDTYDVLGIPIMQEKKIMRNEVSDMLKRYVRTINQPYPPFSSKTVKGKPLFMWARQNKLDTIDIPGKRVTIHSIDVLNTRSISTNDVREKILKDVMSVKGDFRQDEIQEVWNSLPSRKDLFVIKIKVHCSSGTYMRSLAHNLGKDLGVGAIALSIVRAKIGNYTLRDI